MKKNTIEWITIGYEIFSHEGPKGLKVEVIARKVGKSKSSFYHHFADLEIYTSALLEYHMERSKMITEKEAKCKNVIPELLEIILEHKQDLLFNRQLRINRENPAFKICFEKTSQQVGEAIVGIWAKELGLGDNSHLSMMVLKLSMENFFLQITEDTMNYDWLVEYIKGLKKMVTEFQKNKN